MRYLGTRVSLIFLIVTASLSAYLTTIGASTLVSMTPVIALIAVYLVYKEWETNRRVGKLEAELPMTLSKLIAHIDSGVDLISAIKSLSMGSGEMGKLFKNVMKAVDAGVPLPIALENAKPERSKEIARFINRLIMLYRFGGSTDGLYRLLRDIENNRRLALKQYSGKSVMYSLLLITVSSVFPAMFLAYLIVGSMFMDINITPVDALLVPALVIPSIDVLLIAVIYTRRPRFS